MDKESRMFKDLGHRCLCAGDAREKYLRQVITAAADGAVAVVAAEKYLEEAPIIKKYR